MTNLAEIERRLSLFAQGISGRVPRFQKVDAARKSFATEPNTVDLFLPRNFTFFEDDARNRLLYFFMTLQQLMFREFGSFSFQIDVARDLIPYLAELEKPMLYRSSDLACFFHHFRFKDHAARIFYLIESARLESTMLERFPGARKYRELLQIYYQSRFTNINWDGVTSHLENLEFGLQRVVPLSNDLEQCVKPIFIENNNVYSSAQATVDVYRLMVQQGLENALPEFDNMDGEVPLDSLQRVVQLEELQSELDIQNAQIAAFAFSLSEAEGREGEESSNLEGEIRDAQIDAKRERDQLQRRIDVEKSSLGSNSTKNLGTTHCYRYDEWDYLHQRLKRAWCSVYEFRRESDEDADAESVIKNIRPHVTPVRRHFEQLRPAGMRRVRHVNDGDEMDLNSVIDNRIDIRAHHSPDERVYSRQEKIQRDVSAVFLVDLSASTDDPVEPPTIDDSRAPSKPQDLRDPFFDDPYLHGALDSRNVEAGEEIRRIIDIEKESVLLLATALESLGDLYAVYGFSGYGHDNVELLVAKDFNEHLSPASLNAIASMKPMRSTRMGPAIRHGAAKLLKSGTALKILMVISDGFPQDCDYGPDRTSHEYGIQDTAYALKEAQAKGIETFCVTVDRSGHDYLRRMCPDDRYLVIEETDRLSVALQTTYRKLSTK